MITAPAIGGLAAPSPSRADISCRYDPDRLLLSVTASDGSEAGIRRKGPEIRLSDLVKARGGGDLLNVSHDGKRDRIDCGSGRDAIEHPEPFDRLRSCEDILLR